MNIVLNGKPFVLKDDGCVSDLLAEIKADPNRVAVIVNDRIVPRAERASFRIKENDQVEIVTFVGGG